MLLWVVNHACRQRIGGVDRVSLLFATQLVEQDPEEDVPVYLTKLLTVKN